MNRAAYDELLADRNVDKEALRQWVEANNPQAKERLALGVGVSVSLIEKVLASGQLPKLETRLKLSRFTGIEMDVLFPRVTKSKLVRRV